MVEYFYRTFLSIDFGVFAWLWRSYFALFFNRNWVFAYYHWSNAFGYFHGICYVVFDWKQRPSQRNRHFDFCMVVFAIIYDGILLVLMFQFSDYPIEGIMATLAAINPIGLARIFVLLQLNISAMLGYSGAVFKDIFGSGGGMGISMVILFIWIAVPFLLSYIKFNKKDL